MECEFYWTASPWPWRMFPVSWRVSALDLLCAACGSMLMTSICSKWVKKKKKKTRLFCVITVKCADAIYIYLGSTERAKRGPHYRMHGGRRETMRTYIFSLTHASMRGLNYVRPSSSARTYLQQFVVLCIRACAVSRCRQELEKVFTLASEAFYFPELHGYSFGAL